MNKFFTIMGYIIFLAFAIPFLPAVAGMYLYSQHDIPDIDTETPFPMIGYIASLFVLSIAWFYLLSQGVAYLGAS